MPEPEAGQESHPAALKPAPMGAGRGQSSGGNSRNAGLETLLRDFGRKIRQLVESHCRGSQGLDPDDVEQEVRIRLWKALESDRFEPLGASYIQRTVVSTVIDAARRAALRVTDPLPEAGHETLADAAPGPSIEMAVSGRQQAERVWSVIESLPVRRRVPIKLHLQGFSLQEIADLEGVSPEAARKLVSRGMDALKERLVELGMGDAGD
jgi:RNA polymerase sigma factor (sigma-70 family)